MKKSTALFVSFVAALVLGALPMLMAVYLARNAAISAEQDRALAFAQDVVVRAEITADQIAAGFDELKKQAGTSPCSAQSIALMRRIDLRSTNIQAVGYVSDNHMVCSSLDGEVSNVDLGPVDMARPGGVKLRNGVVFPFAPGNKFIVVEHEHYAAIIHKDTTFVATSGTAALALIGTPGRQVLATRGSIAPGWTADPAPGQQVTMVTPDHVVAKVASRRYHLFAVSAIPIVHLRERIAAMVLELVPIGFMVGLLMIAIVYYIARDRLGLPAVIKGGLRRKEFFLVYQPLVDLRTGRWVGAEALIRWEHPRGEVVPPDDFIPVAEHHGLITQITECVVQMVRKDAASLFERDRNFHIGINLAPEDLHTEHTVGLLTRLIEQIRAGPDNLMVEATERGFTDPAMAAPVISALRGRGIKVAIDDFGTGYSSLASLQSLEVDYLKIDKAFVDTLGTEAATGTVALHIIEMAKALNLEMIAEGVTTESQAQSLREQGVQYAQGYLFAKPMRIDQLLAALEQRAEQCEDVQPA